MTFFACGKYTHILCTLVLTHPIQSSDKSLVPRKHLLDQLGVLAVDIQHVLHKLRGNLQ